MKTIHFVTGNAGKMQEAKKLCEEAGIQVKQAEYPYPELQCEDIEEIARYGARDAANHLGKRVIVEDAGLFISALNGFPGPYSSYVFRTLGNEGILKLMAGIKARKACFKSAVGYCEPNRETVTFTGVVEGEIAREIKGERGFGYDSIFIHDGKTFGELTIEEKNEVSHRCKALKTFIEWFNTKDI
ncbi:MAG: XTP/dITP diphosphatase [Methanosarcinales archaeon Met12]|nr:MAG: XTP/dITP diphosphatase [Methanosarcinales archaeon Met12]